MTPLRSGPVSGPPTTGGWSRRELELELDHRRGGCWTALAADGRDWLGPGEVGTEVLAAGSQQPDPQQPDPQQPDPQQPDSTAREWQPAAESVDRLGQPSGSDGWRLVGERASLTRTVSTLSGAVRIGYRVVAGEPWWHQVVLPLRTTAEGVATHGRPGELVGVLGWAHAWVLDGADALGLHWTTDQREDLGLLGLEAGTGAHGPVLTPGLGTPERPVPARRDLSWRLVLTAWRR